MRRLGRGLGHLGEVLGRLEASWDVFDVSFSRLGASWGALEASWRHLGRTSKNINFPRFLKDFGGPGGPAGGNLGLQVGLGRHLAASWGHLGSMLQQGRLQDTLLEPTRGACHASTGALPYIDPPNFGPGAPRGGPGVRLTRITTTRSRDQAWDDGKRVSLV